MWLFFCFLFFFWTLRLDSSVLVSYYNESFFEEEECSFQVKNLLAQLDFDEENHFYYTSFFYRKKENIEAVLYAFHLFQKYGCFVSDGYIKGFFPFLNLFFLGSDLNSSLTAKWMSFKKTLFKGNNYIVWLQKTWLLFRTSIFLKGDKVKSFFCYNKQKGHIYLTKVIGSVDKGVFFIEDGGVIHWGREVIFFRSGHFFVRSSLQDIYGQIQDVVMIEEGVKIVRIGQLTFTSFEDIIKMSQNMQGRVEKIIQRGQK